jgi:hypothetical protein
MQKVWEDETPAARFMRRLVRQRAIEFMRSPDYLKPLRYDFERAKRDQKRFGHIWNEYGTDEAHGENWDAEDEEKKEAAVNQRGSIQNDDLVATCEKSPRERQHQLQGKPEASLGVVEEDQGEGDQILEAREKSKSRRDDFYRRAGGTSP